MQKFVYTTLFATMAIFIQNNALADNVNYHSLTIQNTANFSEQDLKQLSEHITWKRLLLYPDNGKKSALKNIPENAKFFVSGQFDNPYQELLANIEHLKNPQTQNEFACQFPARTHWLLSQLPELNSLNIQPCAEFNTWQKQINAKQFSLVYAEEHINRIGSSFAHTLIKVDNDKSLVSNHSDDAYYINFATDEEFVGNPIKTVQGKSPAKMTIEPFTDKQASYLIRDERDLWAFELALPQDDIDQIIRHLWEIKDLKRFYDFLDNNCASEILRLADVANEKYNLVNDAGKVISPSEVGRVLQANGLLKNGEVSPSYRTLLQNDIAPANADDYKKIMTTNDLPTVNKPSNNPLNTSPVHRLSFGVRHNDDTVYELGVRGAYQDFLDRADGKRKFIYTNIAEVNVVYDDKLKLKNATLIDFLALTPKNAPLAKPSYGGHFKLDRVTDNVGDDKLVLSAGAKYGTAWQAGNDGLCYVLGAGTAELGQVAKGYRLGVGASVGCAYHLSQNTRLHAEVNAPFWYHDKGYLAPKVSLGGQYDISRQLGVRVSADYERADKVEQKGVKVGAVWYFD